MANGVAVSRIRLSIKRWLKAILVMPGYLLRSRLPGQRVLFYHRINPHPFDKLGVVSRELTVHPDAFEAQLRYLSRHGYRVIGTEEFFRMLTSRQAIEPKALLITFDDGYEDNLIWAAPLLKKYGFSAVVFVITEFLGHTTSDVWPRSDPAIYGRFLDAAQIGDLQRSGWEIGSHTARHPLLTNLTAEQQLAELQKSKQQLEEVIGEEVKSIAYPGGDFDERTEESAALAGFALGFTTIPGTNFPSTPLTALRRTEVSASDSMWVFRMKMAGALDWLWFKESRGFRRCVGHLNNLLMAFAHKRSVGID